MKREFNFSEEFANIDEELVKRAGEEWEVQKHHVFQLYSRKIASAAILVMVCSAILGSPAVQAMVKEFTTKIGEALGISKDLSSYAEIVNQKQTKNGISLTLKEVIVDDQVLIASVHVDFDEGEEMPLWINEEKTQINGQCPMTYESTQASGDVGEVSLPSHDLVLIQVYEEQVLPEGEVEVHLVVEAGEFGQIDAKPGGAAQGETEFVYDFILTAEELKSQTVKQELDLTAAASKSGRSDLVFKELAMNDLYCRMIAEGVTWDDPWVNEYELKLKGTDSFGNPVSLAWQGFISENEMRFATDFLGDYEEGVSVEDGDFRMSLPDKDCEYLNLQLYERKIIWDTVEEGQEEDEEYGSQILGSGQEAYMGKENYGWEPVGDPFRVPVAHKETPRP